jgi:hypothetical protein
MTTSITASNIVQHRKEIETTLKALSAKVGIDFNIGRITYNTDGLRCKLEGTVRGAAGTPASAPADPHLVALLKNKYLLPAGTDITKTFKSESLGQVKIVGYNSRARNYPFIVKQEHTGKKYKISSMQAKVICNNPVL